MPQKAQETVTEFRGMLLLQLVEPLKLVLFYQALYEERKQNLLESTEVGLMMLNLLGCKSSVGDQVARLQYSILTLLFYKSKKYENFVYPSCRPSKKAIVFKSSPASLWNSVYLMLSRVSATLP